MQAINRVNFPALFPKKGKARFPQAQGPGEGEAGLKFSAGRRRNLYPAWPDPVKESYGPNQQKCSRTGDPHGRSQFRTEYCTRPGPGRAVGGSTGGREGRPPAGPSQNLLKNL